MHVDDVAQQSAGPLEKIVDPAVTAAVGFVGIAARLKLKISTKSVVITTCKHFAKLLIEAHTSGRGGDPCC